MSIILSLYLYSIHALKSNLTDGTDNRVNGKLSDNKYLMFVIQHGLINGIEIKIFTIIMHYNTKR